MVVYGSVREWRTAYMRDYRAGVRRGKRKPIAEALHLTMTPRNLDIAAKVGIALAGEACIGTETAEQYAQHEAARKAAFRRAVLEMEFGNYVDQANDVASDEALDAGEEPIGTQILEVGQSGCSRCDLPTYHDAICGFCAAELLREAVAA